MSEVCRSERGDIVSIGTDIRDGRRVEGKNGVNVDEKEKRGEGVALGDTLGFDVGEGWRGMMMDVVM